MSDKNDLMEHALGINLYRKRGSYKRFGKRYVKSYRNYFCTTLNHKNYKDWVELQNEHFASSFISPYDDKHIYFQVTDNGIKHLEKSKNYIIRFIN